MENKSYLIEHDLAFVEEEDFQREIIYTHSNTHGKLKGIDLFCGIGGFRLAMERNNIECVFSSDIDVFAQKTYAENFGEKPYGDITKIEASEIPPFDILTAGFPCQPFSYSGLNHGFEDKTRGTLFFDILKIIEYHQPKMFFLENVKGLKSHSNGETLQIIIKSLEEQGYTVKWTILNSLNFGLPQARERWYCVGYKDSLNFEFPEGTRTGVILEDIIDEESNDNEKLKLSNWEMKMIDFHFENVTDEKPRVEHDSSIYNPLSKKGRHGVFSFQKADKALRFHVGDFAKTQVQEMFYTCKNTYAPTIIAGRVPKLWDLQRKLSVLEATRLQGFPDSFKFPVSDAQAYKQLGNSVSVPVIDAILRKMVLTYHLNAKSFNQVVDTLTA
jgi:DNA (cytosine-5)-methyltransferase 1